MENILFDFKYLYTLTPILLKYHVIINDIPRITERGA